MKIKKKFKMLSVSVVSGALMVNVCKKLSETSIITASLTHFRLNKFTPHCILEEFQFQVCYDLDIPREKRLNYLRTVGNLQHLI